MQHCRETVLKLRRRSPRSRAGVIQNTDLLQTVYAFDLINDNSDSLLVCSYLI